MAAGEALGELTEEEQAAFAQAQRAYDDRQYEESIAVLDRLVAAHPACVEVLSMMGLVLRNLEARHAEALPALKAAIRYNVKSAVAWHALAGYHRMEANYEQALKSYKQAFVLAQAGGDASGVHPAFILKDLGRVQLYLRKYHDFVKTCQQLFIANRNSKLDWLAVPVAVDLCDRPREAAAMLNAWFDLPQQIQSSGTVQWTTQMHLYAATLLEQAGDYKAARQQLENFATDYSAGCAVPELTTLLARLYLRDSNYEKAAEHYSYLIDYLPENADYLVGYLCSRPQFKCLLANCFDLPEGSADFRLYPDILTTQGVRSTLYVTEPAPPSKDEVREMNPVDGTYRIAYNAGDLWRQYWLRRVPDVEDSVRDAFASELKTLATNHHDSDAISTFPWAFLPPSHPYVRESMTSWFARKFRKGAMCLILQYQLLMVTEVAGRAQVVEEAFDAAFEEYVTERKTAGVPSGVGEALYHCAKGVVEARILRRYEEGMAKVQQAIDMLPTVIDFWTHKATILDDMGEEEEAIRLHCQCADMDSADKHVRATAVRKLAAAGRLEEARKYHVEFNQTAENKQVTPFDSQDQELEVAVSRGLLRLGRYEDAVQRMHYSLRRLGQQQEDVQDFHSYAIRIGNLATYPDYVRYLRRIFGLRIAQAALGVLMTACVALMDATPGEDDESVSAKAVCAEDLKPVLDDLTCEIPSRHALRNVGSMDCEELGSVLEPLLATFRDDVAHQSFSVMRYSYQLHTRRAFWKPYVVKYSLFQTLKLAGGDWLHPKAFPVLLHSLWSGVFASLGGLEGERLEQAHSFEEHLERGEERFNSSLQINDRYALVQGLVHCLLADRRQQTASTSRSDSDRLRTALERALAKIKSDKPALIQHSGHLAYTRGLAKLHRELASLQPLNFAFAF